MRKKQLSKIIFVLGVLLLVVGGFFYLVLDRSRVLEIETTKGEDLVRFDPHPLTGERCESAQKRPYAVMMANDTRARPLSGIASADIVVEMPVIEDGITRMMALFACGQPEEIGSIRSARHDFIAMAAAFDAIFVHWGGSARALTALRGGAVDNIDALINPTEVFFRKSSARPPHNGFTSYDNLVRASQFLGHRTETIFPPYLYALDSPKKEADSVTLVVGYPAPYTVHYIYSRGSNAYLRWRGGTPEYDKLDNRQAEAKVVIVIRTTIRQLDAEYNKVDVTGAGEAFIFQNGTFILGSWEKAASPLASRLILRDQAGDEVAFVAGSRWIEIVDVDTEIQWGGESL